MYFLMHIAFPALMKTGLVQIVAKINPSALLIAENAELHSLLANSSKDLAQRT